MEKLPRVIYVTHPDEDFSKLDWIDRLHQAGVRWIQLRIKEADLEKSNPELHYMATYHDVAEIMRIKTKKLGMILSINDVPEVAHFSNADGIHFGLTDQVAASQIDDLSIIGVTAHKLTDIEHYKLSRISYFGVGPLRETSTKKDTKTPLGILGFANWIIGSNTLNIPTPVFAIGGININDIAGLKKVGVYGIAVSGLFHCGGFKVEQMTEVVNKMEE